MGLLGLATDPASPIAQLGGLFGYAASKTALNAFTLRLAIELRDKRFATLPDDGPTGGFFDDPGRVPW